MKKSLFAILCALAFAAHATDKHGTPTPTGDPVPTAELPQATADAAATASAAADAAASATGGAAQAIGGTGNASAAAGDVVSNLAYATDYRALAFADPHTAPIPIQPKGDCFTPGEGHKQRAKRWWIFYEVSATADWDEQCAQYYLTLAQLEIERERAITERIRAELDYRRELAK